MKHRFENFGGIVAVNNPPFLAFVDRNFMRELGYTESSLWEKDDQTINILSAPTEVHFSITNACNVGCSHCYMASGERDSHEMDTATLKGALKKLQSIGVFHVALGGGEALLRPDLFELAEYAREIGLIPNLTISGHAVTEEIAKQLTLFGQVNLSIDGIDKTSDVFRNPKMFDLADKALTLLVDAGVKTGINCVMGRNNFKAIPQLFKYAKEKKVNEIEFLRLKPAGRGIDRYKNERTTYDQNISLIPLLSKYSKKYKIEAKIDCSFIPMLCYHNPPLDFLEKTATYGCEAGNVLIGAKSDGKINGCSFLPAIELSIFDFHDQWYTSPYFKKLRSWPSRAKKPCKTCKYLNICKGGCHAVALHESGSMDAPDPDCPMVINYFSKKKIMMSAFNQKLARLCVVTGLYICLLSGSVYILQNNTKDGQISLNKIIANEIRAKNYLKLISNAQKQYYAVDWDRDGIKNYAEFVVHLWQTVDEDAHPVRNNFIPKKLAFAMGASRAIHGYYFQSIRIKELQNSSTNLSKKNEHQNQQSIDIDLTNEWAITAIPADYGLTGTLSFIISSSGKIYAKDYRNRSVKSIPENFIPTGWKEITDELDIRKLHT